MNSLLHLPAVVSHHDLKGLRHLYDSVEANVRGLRALGVSADSYGSLLTSILMNKLPSETRIVVSRELKGDVWSMEDIMSIVSREIIAQERSFASLEHSQSHKGRMVFKKHPTTATNLLTGSEGGPHCVFCGKSHQSVACTSITDVGARRDVLRKTGRCYVCLRRHHLSRDCRSQTHCSKCHGRHHTSICPRTMATEHSSANPHDLAQVSQSSSLPKNPTLLPSTMNMYTDVRSPVLLQTAKVQLSNLESSHNGSLSVVVRMVMDTGSQRTYVTQRVKQSLHLSTLQQENLLIKTFATTSAMTTKCDLVEFGLKTSDGELMEIHALVVPLICEPLSSQPITQCRDYAHLSDLELADSANMSDHLEVDLLIGSDLYWKLVTGRVRRGRNGPLAVHTRVGWVLSGPVDHVTSSVSLTLCCTNDLKIDTCFCANNLDDTLKRFWDLESLGITKDESSVYAKFTEDNLYW